LHLCNVIEIFWWEKVTWQKGEDLLAISISKWHWHYHVKTHQLFCVNIQILMKRKNWLMWCYCDIFFLWFKLHWRHQILELHKIKEVNPFVLGWQWWYQIGCKFHLWWMQYQFIDERSWMWLKEVHVVAFVPCEG